MSSSKKKSSANRAAPAANTTFDIDNLNELTINNDDLEVDDFCRGYGVDTNKYNE